MEPKPIVELHPCNWLLCRRRWNPWCKTRWILCYQTQHQQDIVYLQSDVLHLMSWVSNVRFIWRKVVAREGVTRLPELPWASQLFIHFLTKRGESLVHAETNRWLGELGDSSSQVIQYFLMVGSPSWPCPSRSTRSRRDNQSMRKRWFRQSEHARALLARA